MRLVATTLACGCALSAATVAAIPQAGTPAPAPPKPQPAFEKHWEQPIGVPGRPAITPGAARVFITDDETGIEARSAVDGLLAWTQPARSALPAVVTRDLVFVASATRLLAFHEGTGADRWARETSGPITGLVEHGDGVIVAAGASLQSWSADGTRRWERQLEAPVLPGLLASDQGLVYAGIDGPILAGVDAATGAIRWVTRLETQPRALTASGGRLYFGGEDRALYAYTQRGGRDWRFKQADTVGAPAVDTRFVYAALWDNTIVAHTRDKGHLEWRGQLEGRPARGPMLVGEFIVAPLLSARLAIFSRQSRTPVTNVTSTPASPSLDRLVAIAASPDATRVYIVATLQNDSRVLLSFRRLN